MSHQLPDSQTTIGQFLTKASQLPSRPSDQLRQPGRMIFAMDATASRQAQWDRACHLQANMFTATDTLGGIDIQLCYYRGYQEFYQSPWYQNSADLVNDMSRVHCLGGYTQIERLLQHSLKEHRQHPLQAVIIIADALEEDLDRLCHLAGQCGILGLPLFIFQDSQDLLVERAFKQLASLSRGAYAVLNQQSANQLADFLTAAATYASAGQQALRKLSSPAAQYLLSQLEQY